MAALLLSVIRSALIAFDATTYVRVAYRHLAGEPVVFSGRVLRHVDRPRIGLPYSRNTLALGEPLPPPHCEQCRHHLTVEGVRPCWLASGPLSV